MYKFKNIGITGVVVFLSLAFNAPAKAEFNLDSLQKQSEALVNETQLENQKAVIRLSHAKELLGKKYKQSVVKKGESVPALDDVLAAWTARGLPAKFKNKSKLVAQAILEQSDKYGFDPIFLMAVIENESSFDPKVVGTSGEIGLMQISKETAEWITEKYDLPWEGADSLKDPVTNIRIGSAYMAYLREEFDSQSQLYIAAYNMGSGNLRKLLGKRKRPKQYPERVMQRYVKFYTQLSQQLVSTAAELE